MATSKKLFRQREISSNGGRCRVARNCLFSRWTSGARPPVQRCSMRTAGSWPGPARAASTPFATLRMAEPSFPRRYYVERRPNACERHCKRGARLRRCEKFPSPRWAPPPSGTACSDLIAKAGRSRRFTHGPIHAAPTMRFGCARNSTKEKSTRGPAACCALRFGPQNCAGSVARRGRCSSAWSAGSRPLNGSSKNCSARLGAATPWRAPPDFTISGRNDGIPPCARPVASRSNSLAI